MEHIILYIPNIMKFKIILLILFLFSCERANTVSQNASEKNFIPFKGQLDGKVLVGNYDPKFPKLRDKKDHSIFLELIIHLKEPAIDLPAGDDGLPDEKRKQHAFACGERVLSAISKHGSVLYVANFFWFHQFHLYTFVQEGHFDNKMSEEINEIMYEVPQRCNLVTAIRSDSDWEAMTLFSK